MKRFFLLATFVCAALFTACEGYDDSELVNRLDNFENRLKKLEELCSQMNTNISSLQTIVNAIQKNDQISAIAPINKDGKEIGYTIVFTSGKSITIYHGTDGKDGQNGQNGQDGHTPIIGVKQDTDGNYYWTLDGEWLTDANGNKIKANGTDGKDGADGADGENGADGKDGEDGTDGKDGENGTDGKDGADGITPQLKIENEYWYISYDNGATWTQLGKATGEDGADGKDGVDGTNGTNGADGKDGADGDSFFQDVIEDEDNVYFILADGTTITIPKSSGSQSVELTYIPRYSDGKATVFYTTKSDSYVEFDFEVSPANAASNWRDIATVKAVYTETRATVDFVDMDILGWTTDSNEGVITVKASGANLSSAFFNGSQEASARLVIEGNGVNIMSDYIPMIARPINAPANNEIWYTSTDGEIVDPSNPCNFVATVFKATIVSNTYENGKGVIKFDQAITNIGLQAFSGCSRLTSITIPNGVTSIEDYAFNDCSSLTSVTIPNGVTSIGEAAFNDCSSLTSVTIPNGVTSIGEAAFDGCSRLTSVTIPNSVTSIGGYAFWECSSLTSVTIPNSVTSIGRYAFYKCSSLTSVTIPNSVTSIGIGAFYGCSSLTSVTIPNSVTNIEKYAFRGCSSLTSVTIPNSVTSIGEAAFDDCSSLTSVTIPNSVTSIGEDAFDDCSSLTSVTIPNSVTSIGSSAFSFCSSLTEVICKPTNPPTGGSFMFDWINSSAKIYVPAGSGAAYKAAPYWSDYASIIEEKEM